jgi:hypothetical protein
MRRDLLSSIQKGDRRMSEMDGAILRSMERCVGQLIQSTWEDLVSTEEIHRDPLDFSGIHPLGSPCLLPYLEQPGLYLVFGPLPELRILHLEAARSTMHGALTSKLIPGPEWSWGWRWETDTNPIPTFAACVAMEDAWTYIPAMKTLLGRYLVPLQTTFGRVGEQVSFS